MRPHCSLWFRRPPLVNTTFRGCKRWTTGRRTFFGLPNLDSLLNQNKTEHEQTYHARKILPYTQRQLYELVADVDDYHRFVPYCTGSKVLTSRLVHSQEGDTVVRKEARLTVGFLAFKESYVSEVTCRPYLSVEAVASSEIPLFRKLVTTWRFQAASPSSPHPVKAGISSSSGHLATTAGGPTLLSIDLSFSFSNPVYAAASTAFFKQVSSMMVEAFEKRCLEVYGQGQK